MILHQKFRMLNQKNGLFNEKNSDFESSNSDFASKKNLNQKFMIFNLQISNLDPFFSGLQIKKHAVYISHFFLKTEDGAPSLHRDLLRSRRLLKWRGGETLGGVKVRVILRASPCSCAANCKFKYVTVSASVLKRQLEQWKIIKQPNPKRQSPKQAIKNSIKTQKHIQATISWTLVNNRSRSTSWSRAQSAICWSSPASSS